MNIPPDGANDLNNGPRRGNAVTNAIVDICRAVIDANREWTSTHDMAVRLVGPIAVLAIAGYYMEANKRKEARLAVWKENLLKQSEDLKAKTEAFASAKGMPRDKRLDQWIDELTKEENRKAYEASREVDVMQPQIKEILKIKCSPIKKKELRAPLEEALQSRILAHPSPFDHYGMREQVFKDYQNILKKDIRHCDIPVIGYGDNGELYKLYRDNWKLKIELGKYKHVLEQLKKTSAEQGVRDAVGHNTNTKKGFFSGSRR